jgi:hypothetical protein
VSKRDEKFPDVDWLTDALAADWNPGFIREFRAWADKLDEEQPPLAEVSRGWSTSWTVH